jgi:hypothetical protein
LSTRKLSKGSASIPLQLPEILGFRFRGGESLEVEASAFAALGKRGGHIQTPPFWGDLNWVEILCSHDAHVTLNIN